jgi:hypothetical protein
MSPLPVTVAVRVSVTRTSALPEPFITRDRDRRFAGDDGLTHADTLVAEHARRWERRGADGDAEIGVAQAGGDDADEDLFGARGVELDIGRGEAGAGGLDDRGGGGGARGRPPAEARLRRGR